MKNYRIIFLISFLAIFCFIAACPLIALADDMDPGQDRSVGAGQDTFWGIENPLKADSFTELLVNIINWATGIASTVAVLMVVIAGFQYMISGGDENKTKSAMNTIKWSLIGLVIILMSWGILKEVLSILNG